MQYHSNITNTHRELTVLLPPNYDSAKKYPVLYLLHGLDGDDTYWLRGKPDILLAEAIAVHNANEMILVLPNTRVRVNDQRDPQDAHTLEHYHAFDLIREEIIDNIMPFISSHFSIKEGRENTAVAGFSMGGREALYIGLSRPDLFGACAGLCPAPGLLPYRNEINGEPGLFTMNTLKLPDKYRQNTYVLLCAGTSDTIVSGVPESYHNAFTQNEITHTYHVYSGGEHNYDTAGLGLKEFIIHLF